MIVNCYSEFISFFTCSCRRKPECYPSKHYHFWNSWIVQFYCILSLYLLVLAEKEAWRLHLLVWNARTHTKSMVYRNMLEVDFYKLHWIVSRFCILYVLLLWSIKSEFCGSCIRIRPSCVHICGLN